MIIKLVILYIAVFIAVSIGLFSLCFALAAIMNVIDIKRKKETERKRNEIYDKIPSQSFRPKTGFVNNQE